LDSGSIDATIEPSVFGRLQASATGYIRLFLVLYGVVVASIGVIALDNDIHGASAGLSPYRLGQIDATMSVLEGHGPPLTSTNDPQTAQPIAVDDDRGGFVYVPLVAYLLHTRNVDAILKWSFIVFFAPLLLIFPLLFYEITRSLAAAIAAPLVLLGHTAFLRTSAFFWMPAWANLLLLPLLLLLNRRWREWFIWLLVPLAVVASFASSVRANAGLGFIIGAIVLIVTHAPRWRVRLSMVALVLLAYLSVGSFAMHAVQVQRDRVVGHDLTSPYPNGHPLWHNLYMGLGYIKNPYGIRIKDAVAVAAAQKEDPGAAFPTKRYERALRKVYFRMLEHHPRFVAHDYAVKASVVARSTVIWFPAVVVLVPVLLLIGDAGARRRRRFELLLLSGAGLVGAATGVLVNPEPVAENQSAWYSFLLVLLLVSVGWLAQPLERIVLAPAARTAERVIQLVALMGWRHAARALTAQMREAVVPSFRGHRQRVLERGARLAPARVALRLVLVATVVAAFFVADARTRSSFAAATYWGAQGQLVAPTNAGRPFAHWTFNSSLPRGWSARAQKRVRQGQLMVKTNNERYGHQLESVPRRLGPGRYVLQVDGRVLSGSMRVGVVDARVETYIADGIFWAGQDFSQGKRVVVSFELAEAAPVKILFTNYKIADERTRWSLRSVELRRLPGGCRLFDPFSSFGPTTRATA
jgi:hypothetical protein